MSAIEKEDDDYLRSCLREVITPLCESMLDSKASWPNLLPWLLGTFFFFKNFFEYHHIRNRF